MQQPDDVAEQNDVIQPAPINQPQRQVARVRHQDRTPKTPASRVRLGAAGDGPGRHVLAAPGIRDGDNVHAAVRWSAE